MLTPSRAWASLESKRNAQASADHGEGTMEGRKGRDGKTGSMPGTTARPGDAGRCQEKLGYAYP